MFEDQVKDMEEQREDSASKITRWGTIGGAVVVICSIIVYLIGTRFPTIEAVQATKQTLEAKDESIDKKYGEKCIAIDFRISKIELDQSEYRTDMKWVRQTLQEMKEAR